MNRCLHISIHERAGDSPRSATTHAPGQSGHDPGTSYVMPPPDGNDPGTSYVMPPPDDPSAGSGAPNPQGASGACDTRVTVRDCGCGCGCGCAAPAGQQPAAGGTPATIPGVTARDYSGFVIVRMAPGIDDKTAESLWALAGSQTPELTGLQAVLQMGLEAAKAEQKVREVTPKPRRQPAHEPAGVLVSRPLVELRRRECSDLSNRADCLAQIHALEGQAATSPFPPLHSLAAYWRLDLREHPTLVEEVVARLNRLAEVDLAYRELTANDAAAAPGQLFAEDQGYLDDAPVGISASWAWKSLGSTTSQKPTICDLEQGWNPDHQDLQNLNLPAIIYGANRAPDEGSSGYHGTAVLGQLAAAGTSALGVKGAAADLGRFVLASHYKAKAENHVFAGTSGHVAAAITQALALAVSPLKAGDILLLEFQRALLPAEVDEADLDAIRLASGLGVTVVEAAGNGGVDLDGWTSPDTGRSLNRANPSFRDSGAILVGAARAALPHDRAPFSNYGSRLDCYGWGEAVTTCGYGDLAGTATTNFYTNAFNGTSSASPIIAGAAALVQALHFDKAGYWLDPRALRTLLSDPATGTRQGPNVPGFIGVMPDLKAIVRGRLQLVPDSYMRRHVGDDDGSSSPREEISSSPDILLWNGPDPADRFGEGPRANTPAPGTPFDPADPSAIYPNKLHVRLRNRGGGTDRARVHLFASPAATLITPERWMPIGFVKVQGIAQGDTLTVSPPLAVDPRQRWTPDASKWPAGVLPAGVVPAYSFLAVQVPWEKIPDLPVGLARPRALPPGPPYFDWAEYRSFLRGPGVAWRNVHPVQAATDMTLAFLLAGTPDRSRQFDFEVIQRLPAQATVTLKVPDALAAKLRQRQPWLANVLGNLTLPHRPRTTLGPVALAAGVCAHAAFQVQIGSVALLRGHSLAIRQLWRGEEVGRITWWFVGPRAGH
jgi:serine protease